jgi:hypothetical protein
MLPYPSNLIRDVNKTIITRLHTVHGKPAIVKPKQAHQRGKLAESVSRCRSVVKPGSNEGGAMVLMARK